jgi:DNA ligase 1
MLKPKNSSRTEIQKWYQWKADPYSIYVVLMYAQKGEGKFSNIFSEYTFGVSHGDTFISIARTSSGVSELEIIEINEFVKKNTIEKFGPVRTVEPTLVFELGFDALIISKRHKSNLQLQGAKVIRKRDDLTLEDVSNLSYLRGLMQ